MLWLAVLSRIQLNIGHFKCRVITIENLLFDATGHVKLCDFGSATTDSVTPNENWSALQRTQLEDEVLKCAKFKSQSVISNY
ncbi:unnamed protein product [Gongylonema pulchrum]|uniref:Protein kinase domain-containing protein n=1 Tax=Gongylonema pulchrum TaxID=637853 RepID=A0A183E469_9BILA|nr:unnamed protein product [Gongylonema pulchrum]